MVDPHVALLADELNQLALAVEALAIITPNTEREFARARRREVLETARKVRERVAELIPG